MQFSVKRDVLLKSLNFVQGIVEKKNTLPILSNVLLQLQNNKLSIVATDLDIIFYDQISDVKINYYLNGGDISPNRLRAVPEGTVDDGLAKLDS